MALTLPNYSPHTSSNNTGSLGGPNSNTNTNTGGSNGKHSSATTSLSILEALAPTKDPKEKMRKQRAIAKCCVDSIQRIDGYRYSFHNCWNSREDDSFRFSYYCNDSLLNKDRAANGKGSKLGKRATKPVYDCKGVLSVKFSATKQSLDVHYKHVPIHKTYEERAPPPRKDSKRRKFLEENDPDALTRISNRPRPAKPQEETTPETANVPPKPPKKKKPRKEEEPKAVPNSIESDLRAQSLRSLLELIQVDHEPPPPTLPPFPSAAPQRPVEQASTNIPKQSRANDDQQHQQLQQGQPQQSPVRPQPATQSTRKRPRNSCDVCKSKKTKCDGTRPQCQTCIDKKRQCFYSESAHPDSLGNITNGAQVNADAAPQSQSSNNKLSELEIMKKKLEEAQARILQLETEKSRSASVAQQTPQPQHRPPSRSQSQSQSKSQTPAHVQAQATPKVQPANQPQVQTQVQTPAQQRIQPQIQTTQQLQAPQYSHFNGQPGLPTYNVNRQHPPQPQPTHQLQDATTGKSQLSYVVVLN